MNPAARFVLAILGLVAVGTTSTLCVLALRSGEGKDVKEIAVFALGAVSGVLAKVGYDAAKEHLQESDQKPIPVTGPNGGPVETTDADPKA